MVQQADAAAPEALQLTHSQQALLDAIPAPIWFKDAQGIYRGCNAAFEAYLGRRRDEIVGQSVYGVAPPDLAEIYRKADQALLDTGGTQVYESEVAYADGVRRRVIFQKSVVRDEHGRVVGLAGAIIDVTAQRRAEAELRQAMEERERTHARLQEADRLASIGTLAAGVAHELNDPLSFVLSNLGYATGALQGLQDGGPPLARAAVEELVQCLDEARQGAERMRVIVRELRALSRGDEAGFGPVELGRALEYAIGLTWSQLHGRARLVRELAPVPRVVGNEIRLGQVFLNLLVNAAENIPEGSHRQHQITVRTLVRRPGWVTAEVSDTGSGMTEEARRRIFDPIFTSRIPGDGAGLGLWVCHGLVQAHGGEIEVESEPGRGTTFRVSFPEAPERAAPAPPPVPPPDRPRVLVIDDEPFVGATVRRQLAADHEVEVVSSGEEAMRRLAAGATYDAVVCDVIMPGVDGAAVRREVARLVPALADRILFITGGATTHEAQRLLQSGVPWLEKPFDREALLQALARVLATR